jgi:hypothetical protein
MHQSLQKLNSIENKISEILVKKQLKINPKIIAITKTFPISVISPLLESGHIHYGENKIQEAENKWEGIKEKYQNVALHMVGKLQSNKAKKAIQLFDYIHSLDNLKLAKLLSRFENELNKKVKIFIQVNIAEENQKTGISLNELENFYNFCKKDLNLNIIGLMCIPPVDSDSIEYFKTLKQYSLKLNLNDLSMGMSNDYEQAILCGSTYLRLGTVIFGQRSI